MKRILTVLAAALVAAGIVTAATPRANASAWAWYSDSVEYWYMSDKPVNDITYYAANGELVRAHKVQFAPMLFNLGGPPMYQTSRYITAKPGGQVVGSSVLSYGRVAQCKVYVNQRVADSDYSRDSSKYPVARC